MPARTTAFNFHDARGEGETAVRRGLLELAKKLLVTQGASALTVREFAQRAGCSTKVVYTIFGGKNGISEALYCEGFELLRVAIERERRRHTDAVEALAPVALAYRTFALANRALFGVMFGTAFPEYEPSPSAKDCAGLALGALEDAVVAARGPNARRSPTSREGAVRIWAAVHGPVCLELQGIPPFDTDGARLTAAAVADVLAGLSATSSPRKSRETTSD